MNDLRPQSPMRAAQANMRGSAPRRFYRAAGVAAHETPEGRRLFALTLDGRVARTPKKRLLAAPSSAIAEGIAAEWAAQGEALDLARMPLTRLANAAIDGVADASLETRAAILAFAASDVVCYRAEGPENLVAAQAEALNPALEFAQAALHADLKVGVGIMPIEQPAAALLAIERALSPIDEPFELAAMHVATSLMGSAVLALALRAGRFSAEDVWRRAHVDENHQIARWGEDEEAAERRAVRWRDMQAAACVLAASRAEADEVRR